MHFHITQGECWSEVTLSQLHLEACGAFFVPLLYLFKMSPSIAAIMAVLCSIRHFSIAASIMAAPNLFIKHIFLKKTLLTKVCSANELKQN